MIVGVTHRWFGIFAIPFDQRGSTMRFSLDYFTEVFAVYDFTTAQRFKQ